MLFNMLRGPLEQLPGLLNYYAELFVSLKRIEEFLEQEDRDEEVVDWVEKADPFALALEVHNASFAWRKRGGMGE